MQSFSAPFGEINATTRRRSATAASQAFSADRLQPYRDALFATQSLEQSFAADSARAAAALREGDDAAYADAARAAQLATSEEMRLLADATKQKLALYAEEARFYEITQQQKSSLSQEGARRRNTPPSSPRCKDRRLSATNRSPRNSASTT